MASLNICALQYLHFCVMVKVEGIVMMMFRVRVNRVNPNPNPNPNPIPNPNPELHEVCSKYDPCRTSEELLFAHLGECHFKKKRQLETFNNQRITKLIRLE